MWSTGASIAHARRRLDVAHEALAQLPIKIEEQRGLTVAEIAARSRKHAAALLRKGQQLRVIFVDHMMLVRSSDRYSGNRVREVGEISEGLTSWRRSLTSPWWRCVSSTARSRAAKTSVPRCRTCVTRGEIEQNASLVTFLYRPPTTWSACARTIPRRTRRATSSWRSVRNKLECIIDKNRNGRVGVVEHSSTSAPTPCATHRFL